MKFGQSKSFNLATKIIGRNMSPNPQIDKPNDFTKILNDCKFKKLKLNLRGN
jgi:hypothetical protein